MKYLLVVGFHCDVYRREPRARLFFNDKLIDEFNIKVDKGEIQLKKISKKEEEGSSLKWLK